MKGPCKTALRQLLDLGYWVMLKGCLDDNYYIEIKEERDELNVLFSLYGKTPELACNAALNQVRAIERAKNGGTHERRATKRKPPKRTI